MTSAASSLDHSQTIKLNFKNKVSIYQMSDWKRAINSFLDGIWKQPRDFSTIAGIVFGDVAVFINRRGGYEISYPPSAMGKSSGLSLDRSMVHAVTSEPDKLELGLARFVRNPNIKMLAIQFPCEMLMLWKSDVKTELHYIVVDRKF